MRGEMSVQEESLKRVSVTSVSTGAERAESGAAMAMATSPKRMMRKSILSFGGWFCCLD